MTRAVGPTAPAAAGPPFPPTERLLPVGAAGGRHAVHRLGPVTVEFEGWLDDRQALAATLGAPAGADDAALVARAYDRWGDAFVERLGGGFALCLHDARDGRVRLARDRVGVVPLFYADTGHGLLASPSPEALRRHPLVRAPISRDALVAHLAGAGRDVRGSFYEGIRRLLPGHVLRAGPGSGPPELTRYWSPLDGGLPHWSGDDEAESFPAVMAAGIRRYLVHGRPGVYLSGGLDSGTVATVAADVCHEDGRPPPHAFSLVFDDPDSNEERIQRGVATGLGIPQTLVPVDLQHDPLRAFEASLALNDDWPHPLASTFRSVYLALGRRAVGSGCDVILTGDGGDEWLALHVTVAADLLRRLDVSELRALVNVVRVGYGLPPLRAARRVLWEEGMKLLLVDAAAGAAQRLLPGRLAARRRRRAGADLPGWLAPDGSLRAGLVDRMAAPAPGTTRYRGAVVRDTLEHPLTLLYMEESFESGRRIGAPILKPFYDAEVIRRLVRMPPRLRAAGGRSKGLLRRLLHARFPELGFDRQLKPYATNFNGTMVMSGLEHDWPHLGGFQALADLGIVAADKVDALVTDSLRRGHLADQQAVHKTLWMLLCTERWVRSRHGV